VCGSCGTCSLAAGTPDPRLPSAGERFLVGTKMLTIAESLVALSLGTAGTVPQAGQEAEPPRPVVVVPFEGELSEMLVALAVRGLRHAEELGAAAVVFEIDSPGGEIGLMDRIALQIDGAKPGVTAAYVVQKAVSAGALIALTCDRLYMAPGSFIGSARPWRLSPFGANEELEEKFLSAFRSQFRAKAQSNNRNAALAEAMVDDDIAVVEVTINGVPSIVNEEDVEQLKQLHGRQNVEIVRTICPKDSLLNLTAKEALELGFIDGIALERKEVLAQLGLAQSPVVLLTPSWSERLVGLVQRFGWLLLIAGLIGMFIEIKTPGFGAPGVTGLLCIGLVLFGKYLAGLAEMTEILLFVAGLCLIAAEVFLFPGTLVAGLAGVGLLAVGLVLSFQAVPYPESGAPWQSQQWWSNFGELALAVAGGIGGMFAVAVLAPHLPLLQRMVLRRQRTPGPPAATGTGTLDDWRPPLHARGTAVTPLHPAGKVEIQGHWVDAVAEGKFVDAGTRVEVCEHAGNRVVVRALDPQE